MKKSIITIGILLFFCCAKIWAQAPSWSVTPTDFANSMNLTCQVRLDEVPENGAANLLGAFVGGELRGIASPLMVGQDAYYFLTVHANVVSGEDVSFRVYLDDSGTVHPGEETVPFQKSAVVGSFAESFKINISALDDFPVLLAEFPHLSTHQGFPFEKIPLPGYRQGLDNDPVAWTVTDGSHLSAAILPGDTLVVTPNDPSWLGTDSVLVTATEQGTANSFAASQYVKFTVLPDYDGPAFDYIPVLFVQPDLPLPGGHVDDRLSYGGSCLEYEIRLDLPEGDTTGPVWAQPTTNSGSMTIAVDVQYSGHSIEGLDNVLGGFVGGTFAGVASPKFEDGTWRYYLTLANVATGEINLKFYDAERQYWHEKNIGIDFSPAANLGTAENPFVMDYSPILVSVAPTGEWTTEVLIPGWMGEKTGRFYATDCLYDVKHDSQPVTFAINRCPAQRLKFDEWGAICLRTMLNADSATVIWYEHSFETGAGATHGLFTTGIFNYESQNSVGCHNIIGCPVKVEHGGADVLAPYISVGGYTDCEKLFYARTFDDVSHPVMVCQNVSIYLDENGEASLTPEQVGGSSFASCGVFDLSLDGTEFTCQDIGPNPVILTATDLAGRTSQCSRTVTVRDTIKPVALCKDATVTLNSSGSLVIDPLLLDNGSSDNCQVANRWTSPSVLYCQHQGTNTVTLHVKDADGSVGTCTSQVTVLPFFTVQNIIVTNTSCTASNGSIKVLATALGGQIAFSKDGGSSWQFSNTFNQLTVGSYHVKIRAYGTFNCIEDLGWINVGPTNPATWYKDLDADGYSDGTTLLGCTKPIGYVASALPGDCDDDDPNIHPAATEICNGTDDNCNGQVDEISCAPCPVSLALNGNISAGTYHASNTLSADGTVQNGTAVTLKAGDGILLEPGFEVELGGTLEANIEACTQLQPGTTGGN